MGFDLSTLLRAAHILTAALWIGAAALLTVYVMPSARAAGAAGGSVVAEAMRRGLGAFMASVAGTTVLTGAGLYWVRFKVAGAAGMHSTGGILLSLGALAGVVALMIGGGVLGRISRELAELSGAAPSDATRARIAALHQRGATASRITLSLLVGALLLMVFSRSF